MYSFAQVWGREPCKIATLVGSRTCRQVHERMQELAGPSGELGAEGQVGEEGQQRRGKGRKQVRGAVDLQCLEVNACPHLCMQVSRCLKQRAVQLLTELRVQGEKALSEHSAFLPQAKTQFKRPPAVAERAKRRTDQVGRHFHMHHRRQWKGFKLA